MAEGTKSVIWLVTGTNSGIGLALTKQLLEGGGSIAVVAVDKHIEKLEKIQAVSDNLVVFKGDLQDTEQINDLFAMIAKHPHLGRVDVLVNNAAKGGCKGILDMSPGELISMAQVNLLAPTICSQLAVRSMEANGGSGHIVNVLSVWAWNIPSREYTHFYSATKHALKTVAECIRIEVASRKLNIKVTNISPGPVETNFNYNSVLDKEEAERVFGGAKAYTRLTAEEVAEAVINAVQAPTNVQVNDVIITPAGYLTC